MASVTISERAARLVIERFKEPATAQMKRHHTVPLLTWASRVYSTDSSGNPIEYGSRFFFSWTSADEIKEYNIVTLTLPNGDALALGPGAVFQTGSHTIEESDGRLTLVSSP